MFIISIRLGFNISSYLTKDLSLTKFETTIGKNRKLYEAECLNQIIWSYLLGVAAWDAATVPVHAQTKKKKLLTLGVPPFFLFTT